MLNIIDAIKKYNAYHLATVAQTTAPDDPKGAGGQFLTGVRDDVLTWIELVKEPGGSLAELVADYRETIQDTAADAAPSSDPAVKWRQFVDLAAYKEDLSQAGTPIDTSLGGYAELALFQIAFRLVSNLLTEIEEG
ncbi:hypothetical protein P1P75_01205 [Streptomyces sp. ID05-39B]|uniref:hypothetical protein n=1 Tax=Streptomyces sp. ID05-39B TaxID=3028664 RepID=UPI0029ABCE4F|nr:hypothetical protein [Streptomyces sp. ID05-39B]MDX3525100.1 hypothetical protein [Streptomyces sp. ID05-39B]